MSTKHELMLARKLVKTLTQMTADANREAALHHSLKQGIEFTAADQAYGWLYEPGGISIIDTAIDVDKKSITVPTRSHWGDIENLIATEGMTFLSEEELKVSKSLFDWDEKYSALMGAPIVDESGNILGGIYFLKNSGEFSEEDEVGLEYLALFTGLGLQMSARLQALNEAEGAKALQRNYLQQVSHDIRSPLTVISGAAGLLNRPIDEDKKAMLIDKIQGSSEKIGSLVEALLQISKAETGRLPLQQSSFNLSSWLQILTNDLTPADESPYEINISPQLEIETDLAALRL